jgi:DNA repair protein RecN (Recombination protein N)
MGGWNMLIELKISNYALIDDLTLTFSPGLNILSGETGAGKSIVIGAINLLLGERASVEQIRQGQESAFIEAIIDSRPPLADATNALLADAGIAVDDEMIIAREIYRNGRGVARVNGRAVPVSFLKDIGQLIIDLHGQHQHQSLLRQDNHIDLLDSFGWEKISGFSENLTKMLKKRQTLKNELGNLGENSAERERRLDILNFQLNEIRSANPLSGEDEELAGREKVLANAEKLCTLVASIYSDLYSGEEEGQVKALVDRLNRSASMLAEAADIDHDLASLYEMLTAASAQLSEASHELRDYQLKLEFEPGELAMIQERINLLNTLKKKYGSTVDDVISFADDLEQQIERLVNSEALAAKLESELAGVEKAISAESLALRKVRQDIAAKLEKLIEENLSDLSLPDARFKVQITAKDTFTALGMDQVEFMFSANRGEEVKPLAKIISGGEVSRVMLALKSILARQDLVPTLIFDEVDSGIGGATIQAVAEKLAALSVYHQVMCVTHSPQIASMADLHYHLYKETVDSRTVTRVEKMEQEKRREELARMLDGAGIDNVSLQHVDNLLERAKRYKAELA